MHKKYLGIAMIAAAIIVCDQATKFWIDAALTRYQQIEVVPHFFNIVHVRNPGVAFGLLQNLSETYRSTLLISTTVLALGLLVFLLAQTPVAHRLERWCLSLILGGAVGNLIDRVRLGEVIDFVDIHWMELYHWPAFNVADACISTGITCMVVLELRRMLAARTEKKRG